MMISPFSRVYTLLKFEESHSLSHEEAGHRGTRRATPDCLTQCLGGVGGKTEHHRKESFSFLVQLSEGVGSAKS